jgi:hypothetical protein
MAMTDPKKEYPNTVAAGIIDHFNAHDDGFDADFYQNDIVVESGGSVAVAERITGRTIALVHVLDLIPTEGENRESGWATDRVVSRVRLSAHNPRGPVEQQQECVALANKARARLQGYEPDVRDCGGPGRIGTSTIEQELSNPQICVYGFDAALELKHNLNADL